MVDVLHMYDRAGVGVGVGVGVEVGVLAHMYAFNKVWGGFDSVTGCGA